MTGCMIRFITAGLMCSITSPILAARNEQDPPPPAREGKIRVLIVTGGHEFERPAFFEMFNGHPDIEWREVQQPDAQQWFAPDKADQYDVMVWYDMYQDISEKAKKDLLALFEQGKPLVALHHCVANYQDWPEALKIIGARYHLKPREGHPNPTFKHDVDVAVKIADPKHPVTRYMRDFVIRDETYKDVEFASGTTPLLKTDHPDSDPLMGWTHVYRNSRVVYLQGGHDSKAFENPNYRRLVIQSVRWVTNRLPDPSEAGYRPLFNGRNLDGWTVVGDPAGYVVRDRILRSDLPYKALWAHTNRMFADFILRVDWKVSENGNSGIFVRAKDAASGHPWITGSEVQISNEPRGIGHCTGSLYGTVSVDPRPDESADTWHHFEIQCRGPHYAVFSDNIPVVDVDSRKVEALFAKPLIGYVGVQDNHSENGYIEYRNIRIKELSMLAGDTTAWRLGTQAFTFHRFTLFETIDKARTLGLKYLEIFPGQRLSPEASDTSFSHDSPVEILDQVKHKLAEADIRLTCYGVVGFKNDEAEARKIFDFARLMGVETITAEPAHDAYDLLDRLTQEYGINVAIHNHPRRPDNPGYIYWNPDEVLKLIKGRNPRIGACADTGHWARSGLNPIDCLRKLEGHIISLHFKDLNKKAPDGHDVIWGTGDCDARGMLAELHRQGFKGAFSIEYEHNWEKSMPEVAGCIEYFRQQAKALGY